MKYKPGDIVRYAEGWYESEKEKAARLVVVEAFDSVQKALIINPEWQTAAGPHNEWVFYEMITPA